MTDCLDVDEMMNGGLNTRCCHNFDVDFQVMTCQMDGDMTQFRPKFRVNKKSNEGANSKSIQFGR